MDFWRGFSARSVNEDRLIEQFVIHADNASNIRRLTPKRKVARWSRAGGTISLSTSAPLRFLLHTSGQPTIRILFWSGPEFLIQMEESDLQLVLACRRGDQLAWERLIRRYQRLIYAIPLRAGLDEDHAAEIFQDVFTTLFQKLNDLEQPEKLQAWLVTTTRRKSLHAISKAQVQQQSYVNNDDPPDMATLIRDEAPLPEEQLLILEEQHRLRIALSSLDERCRALLEMLFYRAEPPTYAEIATALEIPEGSVGPTRARCLAKLLRLLKK